MALNVFALDESNLGFGAKSHEPLGMRDLMEGDVDSDTVIEAARSCPYKVIYVKEADSGDQIIP
ncbi:MAG: hypothetical protein JRN52_03625 [Nitrososphaerota archaeon]|nr:hypothetical protein [Nitrososphaerota archaeon]